MKNHYVRLKLNMLLLVVVGAVLVALLGFFVLGVLSREFDGFVSRIYCALVETVFGRTAQEALESYRVNVTGHREELVLLGLIALMLLAFYCAMGRFTRWLNQIGAAVRQLLAGEEQALTLPRPLAPVQADIRALQGRMAQQRAELQENLQRKSDMVAFLAHDLKTPLTSVVGYLTLIVERDDLTAQQRAEYTAVALNKALRLEELMGEFFDISRMDLKQETAEQVPIQISILLEQLADEFFPLFAEKKLTCHTEIVPNLAVLGDPDRLARVFDNVLRNAVSYSTPGGDVALIARQTESGVEVSITNDGMEIPEQELTHIFEKFYRLDSARSTRTGGAGLGLAIAKEIVDAHGGTIRAESNGKQARFSIVLPAMEGTKQ